MRTDKCSGPKGLSFSFSRDAQSNRARARHSGLFAKDLPPECLCTFCHLMKVISLFFHRQPQSPDTLESSQLEEEVDELSLIDHSEIMSRLTLKQEVGAFRVCFHTLWFTLSWNLILCVHKQGITFYLIGKTRLQQKWGVCEGCCTRRCWYRQGALTMSEGLAKGEISP